MDVLIKRMGELTKVNREKRMKLTRFERVTIGVLVSIIILLMISSVHTRSIVSETNVRVETIKTKTAETTVNNQILQQKIDDLMTYDRLVEIATKYGLTQNEKNVKAVNK